MTAQVSDGSLLLSKYCQRKEISGRLNIFSTLTCKNMKE